MNKMQLYHLNTRHLETKLITQNNTTLNKINGIFLRKGKEDRVNYIKSWIDLYSLRKSKRRWRDKSSLKYFSVDIFLESRAELLQLITLITCFGSLSNADRVELHWVHS